MYYYPQSYHYLRLALTMLLLACSCEIKKPAATPSIVVGAPLANKQNLGFSPSSQELVAKSLGFLIGSTADSPAQLHLIKRSGDIVKVEFSGCFKCSIDAAFATSNGFFLKGQFAIQTSSDAAPKSYSLAFWDFETLRGLYTSRVSKWSRQGSKVLFEAPIQERIYLINHRGQTEASYHVDSWQDFELSSSAKVIVADRRPWPKIDKETVYYIEHGEQILSGRDFYLETSFLEDAVKSREEGCHRYDQYWRMFKAERDGFTRSRVPISMPAGSTMSQSSHHLFVRSLDESSLMVLSNYSELPSLHSFTSKQLQQVDSYNKIAFDGYNLVSYHDQIITAKKRISYKFEDLDYVIRVFGPSHGFADELWALTGDGYLTSIQPTGFLNYDSKIKLNFNRPQDLRLFKIADQIFGYDLGSQQILAITLSKRFYQTTPVTGLATLSNKKIEIMVLRDKAIILSERELFVFQKGQLIPATLDGCKVFAHDIQDPTTLVTIESCNKKVYRKSYHNAASGLKLANSKYYASLDSFLPADLSSQVWLHATGDRFRITRENVNRCTYSSKVFHKNPELVVLPGTASPTRRYTASNLGGRIKSALSLSDKSIMVSTQSGRDLKNLILNSSGTEKSVPQLTGWLIRGGVAARFNDHLIFGEHMGRPAAGLFNSETSNLIVFKIPLELKIHSILPSEPGLGKPTKFRSQPHNGNN